VFKNSMLLIAPFITLSAGCSVSSAAQNEAIGSSPWVSEIPKDSKYSVEYTVGSGKVCRVTVQADEMGVLFEATNFYHPRGKVVYRVTVTKDSNGNFEAHHFHSTLFRNEDKEYPWFDFEFMPYDIFYVQCFLIAKALPEPVQEFLKKYNVQPYNNKIVPEEEVET